MQSAILSIMLAQAVLTPNAETIVGDWRCEQPSAGLEFVWRVSDRLEGRWLVGEVVLNGKPWSIDVWQYDEDGNLGLRRQFTGSTAYIEMTPVSLEGSTLKMEGVREPDGVNTPLAETITMRSETEFEAQWRAYDPEIKELADQPWEICRKDGAKIQDRG